MRLLSISVRGQYKGLNDQTFSFDQSEGKIVALIGLNGSGKSQLLELISEVFAFLERRKRVDFGVKKSMGFGFDLVYCINDVGFKVDLEDGSMEPVVYTLNKEGWEVVSVEDLVLPSIVGYASGLNENLQRGFMKNAVKFYEVMRIRHKRRKDLFNVKAIGPMADINGPYLAKYPGIFSRKPEVEDFADYFVPLHELVELDAPVSNLIYLDYDSAGLALLCLAIFPQDELDKILAEVPFKHPVKVVLQFDFRIGVTEEDAIRYIKMLIRSAGDGAFEAIGSRTSDQQYEQYELDYLAGKITLDLKNPKVIGSLRGDNYDDPLTLFRRLYKLQLLGVKSWQREGRSRLQRDDFFGTVKKPLKAKLPLAVNEIVLSDGAGREVLFDDLSDGEAQLIQVLAAVKIFSGENSLFLLDEPETHLNPAWRTYFHGHLTLAMTKRNNSKEESQVFLSTHSPFMISSLKRNDVYCFRRDSDHQISASRPADETYGASFEVLVKELFGMQSLISQSVIAEIREQLNHGDAQAKEWIENNLGPSAERSYLIKKLSE